MKLSNDVRALFAGIAIVVITSIVRIVTPNVTWMQPVWNVVDVVMFVLLSVVLAAGLFVLIRGAVTGKV